MRFGWMSTIIRSFDIRGDERGIQYRYPSLARFWCLGFLYASFMALMFQKIVLPLIPEMHAGHGLLQNDAIVFHNIAVEVAQRIHDRGWSEWSLFPGAAGNVGLLSAVYAVFGPDPAWFIPLNAAAHATGAMLLYRMGGRLWTGNHGMLGGLIAGIAFLAFPSALQWYGQNHKDAFAIAGTLLVLDAWLELQGESRLPRFALGQLWARTLFGVILVGVVRPYFVMAIVCALSASLVIAEFSLLLRSFRTYVPVVMRPIFLILAVAVAATLFARLEVDTGVGGYLVGDRWRVQLYDLADSDVGRNWRWSSSSLLPTPVDKVFMKASELRVHFVVFGRSVGAGSEIDGDRLPHNMVEVVGYLPRALFVGLFAPFPDSWGERMSAPRLVGAVETAIWYLFAMGFAITLVQAFNRPMVAGLAFCATLLVMLAYMHPNVGTLYRQRFGVWQFCLLCGSVGWARLIVWTLGRQAAAGGTTSWTGVENQGRVHAGAVISGVDRLAASGVLVLLITFLCYLGFLARDLLLVKTLGMHETLDAFFAAAMIPMFFVSFLAMPMADAFTSSFLSVGSEELKESQNILLRHMLGFALILLGGVTVIVVVAAPWIVALVLGANGNQLVDEAATMLRGFAFIILMSAGTVVGNAALNALGRSREAALGQLVVPIMTISALAWTSPGRATLAVIGGMLAGTFLNVVWVVICLRAIGLQLTPSIPTVSVLRSVASSYPRLAVAALLTAGLVPLNYSFAASVASGEMSAWALASKLVILFTGLASVGASAVVLPYLAQLLSREMKQALRDDAYFLVVAGSAVGGLLAAGVAVFAEPLVGAVLAGSLTTEQLRELAEILRVGAMQLPVAIAGTLIGKILVASGAASRVLIASLCGFACNVAIDLLLVPTLGVLGVAIGTLSALVGSTVVAVAVGYRQLGLSVLELLGIMASWLIWAGVCMAVSSQSLVVIICAAVLIVLSLGTQYVLTGENRGSLVRETAV